MTRSLAFPRSRPSRSRSALAAAILLSTLAARPASAQVQAILERDARQGALGGVPIPLAGVAAAEEATALALTPAGIGFVDGANIAWHHEADLTPSSRGDAVFVADRWGNLGLGWGYQSIRPGSGDGDRWNKNTFAITLGDGRSASLGFAWNWFGSPDPDIDHAASWDIGLTLRPGRNVSVAASAMGNDARVGGTRLPVRYDLGAGIRFLNDSLTLTADAVGDDRSRGAFRITHAAGGAWLELTSGLFLSGQIQFPVSSEAGVDQRTLALVAIGWSASHLGISGGPLPTNGSYTFGTRASVERYRGSVGPRRVPGLDVGDELAPPTGIIALIEGRDRDRWGALLERIAEARRDPAVAGLVLRLGNLGVGAGRAEELRAAIAATVKQKPVLVWLDGGDTRAYWVATAATGIAAQPGTPLLVNGLGTSRLFIRDSLARLGIAFEVVKVGAYKSASEPLVRMESTPEAKEATEAVLDDVYGRFVADVAAARRLPPERVRGLVDRGLFTAEDAKKEGLIDELLWQDELEAWAGARAGARADLARYEPETERRAQRWGRPPVVEVIRIEGDIAPGESRDAFGLARLAGAETVAQRIRRAAGDGEVKAIVLRIESPGGDGGAGDAIWREVVRARGKKPVVASLGDVAASAGYLVAVGADIIVSQPSTLTGSIGVFALKPDLSGLLAKVSARRESYRRGENAELLSPAKAWTDSERAAVQRAVDAFYATFVERVAAGRHLPRADVEKVAGGRVWTGKAALERRLVDRLGTLEDAIALARERAGLGDDVVVHRSGEESSALARSLHATARAVAGGGEADAALRALGELAPDLHALAVLSAVGPVVAMPIEWVVP